MLPRRLLFLLSVILVCLWGCGGEDPTGPEPDPGAAAVLVMQADQELENTLFEEINSAPNHPTDIDFTKAYDLYSQALALDPNNLDARFGTSITGLLIVTTDAEITAAFDEWEAYLNDNTPFEVPGTALTLGVPLGFTAGSDAVRLPFDTVTYALLAQPRMMIQLADPQIGRTQDILRDRVLPKLVAAVNHLGVIAGNPDYTFTVTPRMQGDAGASPAEIDLTDIHAVRAGASLLSAVCRILISYELGIATYDSLTLSEALMPGSDWLALRADGAAHMAAVPADLLRATDEIDAALEELLLETDPQHDDVIKIDPGGLTHAEVGDIRAELPRIRELLGDGEIYTEDWDSDPFTPPFPLQVNVGDFFRNPVQDWKTLLPSYSSSVTIASRGYGDYAGVSGTEEVTVEVPADNQYYFYLNKSIQITGEEYVYYEGPVSVRGTLEAVLDANLTNHVLPRCFESASGVVWFSGQLNQGQQNITLNWYVDLYLSKGCVYVPKITWVANSFSEWTFPDPGFNGLLPQIETTEDLFWLFGITGQGWEKELVVDWASLDLGNVSLPPIPKGTRP